MEKKTIGKFISTLRKANGMTQRELGEKLFVSDKTVSRWECDECTPELSLIPSIAEIFGITTDELLCGERNNSCRDVTTSEEVSNKQKAKSDKQFKLMLDRNDRKYKNLTLISIGITIFGFIAAMIANLGFSKGLIAFSLATAFCVASEICQICFAINARITLDEDDDTCSDRIKEANTGVVKTAIAVSFVNILLFAFCLPLVTLINGANYGLVFESWLYSGLLFAAIAFGITYIIYALFVRKVLCERALIVLDEKQKEKIRKNKKLLVKTISIAAVIALVLGVFIVVWNIFGWDLVMKGRTFDNCADFKAFMESDYKRWYNEGYSHIGENGDWVSDVPIHPDSDTFPDMEYGEIKNFEDDVICEYYYNPHLYEQIIFTESSNDKMPVMVITNQAYYEARNTFQMIESIFYTLIVLDFVVATAIYLIKVIKGKKKA